jgi:hypothetical protein
MTFNWNTRLSEEEMRQSGEPAFGTLEWAKQAMQTQPTRADRVLLAKAQVTVGLSYLMGAEPDLLMAKLMLEDALLHIAEARDLHSEEHIKARDDYNSELRSREREGGSKDLE